ncbi:MAG: helix-turn-helix transcriptional regulator [Oscillospiraceae bacterium]|nr:helix-turn-helix transcriptional regulator [Oscillospiraceae bacterium]
MWYYVYNNHGGDTVAKNLKLKSARAAMDMSQQALAEAVGVSRQTINAIEKGDYNPTLNLCIDICKALGKTLDEIFWGND